MTQSLCISFHGFGRKGNRSSRVWLWSGPRYKDKRAKISFEFLSNYICRKEVVLGYQNMSIFGHIKEYNNSCKYVCCIIWKSKMYELNEKQEGVLNY